MNDHEAGWKSWPVAWSAVWVGTLTAIAVGLIIGLVGVATGAHEVSRDASWRSIRMTTLIFNIGGAFFAFVAGGWVACRIAGMRRSEPAMLNGAIVWVLAVPLLLGLAAIGGMGPYSGWYGGLAPARALTSTGDPAAALRNAALGSAVALLLGLVGAVIGGWMASGEPMTFAYYRRRPLTTADDDRARRAARGG